MRRDTILIKELRPHLIRICLIVVSLPSFGHAEDTLLKLLDGTSVTPAVSGLQISTIKGGEVFENFAFGIAQGTGQGPVPLGVGHKIRVASVSKIAVAIATLMLVEEQHFSLDEDVSALLGWKLRNPNFPETPITVRSLLSHTSSVRDGARYFIEAGKGQIRDFFYPGAELWDQGVHWATEPKEEPGTYFSYANLNFGLLAAIIERASNQRFDLFLADRVFEPLALEADFNPCNLSRSQLATTYRKRNAAGDWNVDGAWQPQIDGEKISCFYGMLERSDGAKFLENYELGSNATLFSPQGGLRASASDLSSILRLLANEGALNGRKILKRGSVETMLSPAWSLNAAGDNGRTSGEAQPGGARDGLMTSYGLSVHRIDMRAWGFVDGPAMLLGHLGRAYGVFSFALYDPDSRDGIAMIVTGVADDPFKAPGHSPLTRLEETVLHWWINR